MKADNEFTIFVYYKIPTLEREHYLSALQKLTANIQAQYPHLQLAQQKRPELDKEGRELWMETYHGIASKNLNTFAASLSQSATKYGLPTERKVEVFTALLTDKDAVCT